METYKPTKRSFSRPSKLISVLCVISHLTASVSFASPLFLEGPEPKVPFQVSKKLGTVQEIYFPPDSQVSEIPQVLMIQDAHCIYDAQTAIGRLIRQISEKYGVTAIGLEGAEGETDLEPVKSLPETGTKKEVLDLYLKQSILTGAGREALRKGKPYRFVGLENKDLYEEDRLEALRFLEKKQEIAPVLLNLRNTLLQEKKKIYSMELQDFDRTAEALLEMDHEEGVFSEKVETLLGWLKKSKLGKHEYQILGSLEKIIRLDKKIDHQKLEKETRKFVGKHFQGRIDDPKEILSFLSKQKISPLKLVLYPNLRKALDSERLKEPLRSTELFAELAGAVGQVKQALFRTEAEKELDARWQDLKKLKRILDLQASREDLHSFKNLNDLGKQKALIGQALGSYALAEKREGSILGHLESLLKEEKHSFLVIGGFHREGITAGLKARGISFAVINPSFLLSGTPDEALYLKRLRGDLSIEESKRVPPLQEFNPRTLEEIRQVISRVQMGETVTDSVVSVKGKKTEAKNPRTELAWTQKPPSFELFSGQWLMAGGFSGLVGAGSSLGIQDPEDSDYDVLYRAGFVPRELIKAFEEAQAKGTPLSDQDKVREWVEKELVRLQHVATLVTIDPESTLADITQYGRKLVELLQTRPRHFQQNHEIYRKLLDKITEIKNEAERLRAAHTPENAHFLKQIAKLKNLLREKDESIQDIDERIQALTDYVSKIDLGARFETPGQIALRPDGGMAIAAAEDIFVLNADGTIEEIYSYFSRPTHMFYRNKGARVIELGNALESIPNPWALSYRQDGTLLIAKGKVLLEVDSKTHKITRVFHPQLDDRDRNLEQYLNEFTRRGISVTQLFTISGFAHVAALPDGGFVSVNRSSSMVNVVGKDRKIKSIYINDEVESSALDFFAWVQQREAQGIEIVKLGDLFKPETVVARPDGSFVVASPQTGLFVDFNSNGKIGKVYRGAVFRNGSTQRTDLVPLGAEVVELGERMYGAATVSFTKEGNLLIARQLGQGEKRLNMDAVEISPEGNLVKFYSTLPERALPVFYEFRISHKGLKFIKLPDVLKRPGTVSAGRSGLLYADPNADMVAQFTAEGLLKAYYHGGDAEKKTDPAILDAVRKSEKKNMIIIGETVAELNERKAGYAEEKQKLEQHIRTLEAQLGQSLGEETDYDLLLKSGFVPDELSKAFDAAQKVGRGATEEEKVRKWVEFEIGRIESLQYEALSDPRKALKNLEEYIQRFKDLLQSRPRHFSRNKELYQSLQEKILEVRTWINDLPNKGRKEIRALREKYEKKKDEHERKVEAFRREEEKKNEQARIKLKEAEIEKDKIFDLLVGTWLTGQLSDTEYDFLQRELDRRGNLDQIDIDFFDGKLQKAEWRRIKSESSGSSLGQMVHWTGKINDEERKEALTLVTDLVHELMGSAANRTSDFDPKPYLAELKDLLPSFSGENVKFSEKLGAFLDQDNFEIYFLEPAHYTQEFTKVLSTGRLVATPVFTEKIKEGETGKEKIYISTHAFQNATDSEKLALLAEGLLRLTTGDSEEERKEAFAFSSQVVLTADHPHLTPALRTDLVAYARLKEELITYAQQGDWAKYDEKRVEAVRFLPRLRNQTEGLSKFSLQEFLALIVDEEKLPAFLLSDPTEFVNLTAPADFPVEMKRMVETIVDEMVNEVFEDEITRHQWRTRILNDIKPVTAEDFFPPSQKLFDNPDLPQEYIPDVIIQNITQEINYLQGGGGFFSNVTKKIHLVRSNLTNPIRFRYVLKHELIHYLGYHKVLEIDPRWEFTPTAVHVNEILSQVGEENLALFSKDVSPLVVQLFNRGKQMVERGEGTFLFDPSQQGRTSYVGIQFLEAEVKNLYQHYGIPEDFLDSMQRLEREVGVILAGMMYANRGHNTPFKTLIEFFKYLHGLYRNPTEAEEKWARETLLPELKHYAEWTTSKTVDLNPQPHHMAGWKYQDISGKRAEEKYIPWDLYPRDFDGPNEDVRKSKARDRAYGHLFQSIYQYRYSRAHEAAKELKEDEEKKSVFELLFQVIELPEILKKGLKEMGELIEQFGGMDEARGVGRWIRMVYEARYKLGNPLVASTILSSYPLHIQYLDSLIYRWVNKNEDFHDSRLKNEKVREAIFKTKLAWQQLMFHPTDRDMDPDEMNGLVREEIWPEYLKLFEEAKQLEIRRKMFEDAKKRDPSHWPKVFEDLTEELLKQLDEEFKKLSDEERKQVEQMIRDAMKKAMEKFMGKMGSSGTPQPGGQEGGQKAKPGTMSPGSLSRGQAGRQQGQGGRSGEQAPEDMEKMLEKMKEQIKEIEQALEAVGKGTEDIAQQAGEMEGNAQTIEKEASGNGDLKLAAGEMADKADKLSNTARDLRNNANEFEQNVRKTKDKLDDMKEDIPSSHSGTGEVTDQLEKDAKEIREAIQELERKVAELTRKAKSLKDKVDNQEPSGKIQSHARSAQEASREVAEQSQGVKQATEQTKDVLNDLADKIQSLADRLGQMQKDAQQQAGLPVPDTQGGDQEGEQGQGDQAGQETGQSGEQGQQGEAQESGQTGEQAGDQDQSSDSQDSSKQKGHGEGQDEAKDLSGFEDLLKNLAQFEEIKGPNVSLQKQGDDFVPPKDLLDKDTDIENQRALEQTGLTADQLKKYEEFKKNIKDQIDYLKKGFKRLLIPEDMELFEDGYTSGARLVDPVAGIVGDGGFERRVDLVPPHYRISFVVDISRSMQFPPGMTEQDIIRKMQMEGEGFNRPGASTYYSQIALVMLLEVMFELKNELKDFDIGIDMEVWAFGDRNHKGMTFAGSRKVQPNQIPKTIWILRSKVDSANYSEGTNDSKALTAQVDRAFKDALPDTKYIGFFIGDSADYNIDFFKQKVEELEAQGGVFRFIPLGINDATISEIQKILGKNVLDVSGEKVKQMGEVIMDQLMDQLAPGGRSIFRGSSLGQDVVQDTPIEGFDPRFNFFIRKKDGKEYLIHKTTRAGQELIDFQTERSPGGLRVPRTAVPYTPDNEKYLVEILEGLYPLDEEEYDSISPDGRTFLSVRPDGGFELFEFRDEHFYLKTAATSQIESWEKRKVEEKDYQYPKGVERFRVYESEAGRLLEVQINGNWIPVQTSVEEKSLPVVLQVLPGDEVLIQTGTGNQMKVELFKREGNQYVRTLALMPERSDSRDKYKVLVLVGESGVAKGELLKSALNLLNQEMAFMSVHSGMSKEDFYYYRTIIKEGREYKSSEQFSPMAYGMRFGRIVALDEANKAKLSVLKGLQTDLEEKTYLWKVPFKDAGGAVSYRYMRLPSHPRGRVVMLLNPEGAGYDVNVFDDALKDRMERIYVTYQEPSKELDILSHYAFSGLRISVKDKQDLKQDFSKLIAVAVKLRLKYLGYDEDQIGKIMKDWTLLSNPVKRARFRPAGKKDRELRPPSPRVLINIARTMARVPSYAKYRPLDIITRYYSFDAEKVGAGTRALVERELKKYFDNVKDADGKEVVPFVAVNDVRFRDDFIVVTPKPTTYRSADGSEHTIAWEPVEVRLHPTAPRAMTRKLSDYLSVPQNARFFYHFLQEKMIDQQLRRGVDDIFVGLPGTGKSHSARILQETLSGPDVLNVTFQRQTQIEDVTVQMELRGETGWVEQDLIRGMGNRKNNRPDDFGKLVRFEETNQANPKLTAVTNDISQNRRFLLPDDTEREAGEGFGIVHTINPPGGKTQVNPMSAEQIERNRVWTFDAVPEEQEIEILFKAASGKLNPYFLGHQDDQKKWKGLIAAIRDLRHIAATSPIEFDQSITLRGLKPFVAVLPRRLARAENKDEELLASFLRKNNIDEEYFPKVMEIFKKHGLYDDKGTALDILMAGRPILIEGLDPVTDRQTFNSKINEILRLLQLSEKMNTLNVEAAKIQNELKSALKNWSKDRFLNRLEMADLLIDTYQILEIILEKRNHTPEVKEILRKTRKAIADFLKARYWPPSVLKRNEKESLSGTFGRVVQALPDPRPLYDGTDDLEFDERLALFLLLEKSDAPSAKMILTELASKIDRSIQEISRKKFSAIHEYLPDMTALKLIKNNLQTALPLISDGDNRVYIENMIQSIQKLEKNLQWPVTAPFPRKKLSDAIPDLKHLGLENEITEAQRTSIIEKIEALDGPEVIQTLKDYHSFLITSLYEEYRPGKATDIAEAVKILEALARSRKDIERSKSELDDFLQGFASSLGEEKELELFLKAGFVPQALIDAYQKAQVSGAQKPDDEKLKELIELEIKRLDELEAEAMLDPVEAMANLLEYANKFGDFIRPRLKTIHKYRELMSKVKQVYAVVDKLKKELNPDTLELRQEIHGIKRELADKSAQLRRFTRISENPDRTVDIVSMNALLKSPKAAAFAPDGGGAMIHQIEIDGATSIPGIFFYGPDGVLKRVLVGSPQHLSKIKEVFTSWADGYEKIPIENLGLIMTGIDNRKDLTIAFRPDGNLIFANPVLNLIVEITPESKIKRVYYGNFETTNEKVKTLRQAYLTKQLDAGANMSAEPMIEKISGMSLYPDGRMVVSDARSNALFEWDTEGNLKKIFTEAESSLAAHLKRFRDKNVELIYLPELLVKDAFNELGKVSLSPDGSLAVLLGEDKVLEINALGNMRLYVGNMNFLSGGRKKIAELKQEGYRSFQMADWFDKVTSTVPRPEGGVTVIYDEKESVERLLGRKTGGGAAIVEISAEGKVVRVFAGSGVDRETLTAWKTEGALIFGLRELLKDPRAVIYRADGSFSVIDETNHLLMEIGKDGELIRIARGPLNESNTDEMIGEAQTQNRQIFTEKVRQLSGEVEVLEQAKLEKEGQLGQSLGAQSQTLRASVTQMMENAVEMEEKVVIVLDEDFLAARGTDQQELEYLLRNPSVTVSIRWTKTQGALDRMDLLEKWKLGPGETKHFKTNVGVALDKIDASINRYAEDAEVGAEHVVMVTSDEKYQNQKLSVLNAAKLKYPLLIAHYVAQIGGRLQDDELGILRKVNGQFYASVSELVADLMTEVLGQRLVSTAA